MPADRKIVFDAVKLLRKGQPYTQAEVTVLDTALDRFLASASVTGTEARIAAQAAAPKLPAFQLSELSLSRLKNVKKELADCVKLAITYTPVDFRVQQGERTLTEQKAAVAAGNSRTMKSKHLLQPDGTVWAVDLVALLYGKVTWDFKTYAGIAYAMDRAATQLHLADHIRWGCAWDRVLADFGGDVKSYLMEAAAYAARHPGSDLLDAPHFEWVP